MSELWFADIDDKVFSNIKYQMPKETKEEFGIGDDNFSTVGSSYDDAVFPFIYVDFLSGTEVGNDLDGTEINAVTSSPQIQVTDNQSKNTVREIMKEIILIMKKMKFRMAGTPVYESNGNTHTGTVRFSRVIGASDQF